MVRLALQPEFILSIAGFRVSNTLLTAVLTSLILIALTAVLRLGGRSRLWFLFEAIVDYSLKAVDLVTGDRAESKRVYPLAMTFLLFIVVANWLVLIPGFLGSLVIIRDGRSFTLLKSPTADLNVTLMLAAVSMVSVEYFSISHLGLAKFIGRFINFSSWPLFISGLFELLSELIKVLSLSLRLFGNIFGGEVVIVIVSFLVPLIAPVLFYLLEFFVGFIQAVIFAVLTLAYAKFSTQEQRA